MAEEPFLIDEADRYASLRLIPWWRQERLREARILVVGAGALGSEVLKNLALLGVGHLYVIDRDVVEAANLARSVLYRESDRGRPKSECAARAVKAINPDVSVRGILGDVRTDAGLGLFATMDVVIGGLDNREARLWVNRQCWKAGRPWVDGAIQELMGVVKVFVPPDGSCYECAMTERDYALINLRYSCPMLGRGDVAEGKVPTTPTTASIVAGLQVQEALKILHGLPVREGSAIVFNGAANTFYVTRFPRRADCLSHETYGNVADVPVSAEDPAEALFEATGGERILLDRDLVVSVECPACGARREVGRPRVRVSESEAGSCPRCGGPARARIVHEIERGDARAARPLRESGVAPFDVVRVVTRGGGGVWARLAADREEALRCE
jgi:adenylyltransferase/sulfurtransferase